MVGANPGVSALVPEQMVFGGDNDTDAMTASPIDVDGDLDEVVVVGAAECGGDCSGDGFAGACVGAADLIADLEFFDRLAFAIGEQNFGAGDEAV